MEGDNRLPSFACEVTLRPRLRKVGLYNNIVRNNIVLNDTIVRDQKECVRVAGRRITVGDECAQLAAGSLSLKVYPPHLAKLSPSAASGTVSRVNDLLIPPLPPAGSPPGW